MAELSSNWRVKSALSSPESVKKATKKRGLSGHNSQQEKMSHKTLNRPANATGVECRRTEERHNGGSTTANDLRAVNSILEGRRIYIGNLLYIVKFVDIEKLLESYQIEHIDMAVDPFTGRNLPYCFVDFITAVDASRALEELKSRMFFGRLLKVSVGIPRKGLNGHKKEPPRSDYLVLNGWQRRDAAEGWEDVGDKGCRLFVGGLPQIKAHSDVNIKIGQLFEEFNVIAISKIRSPLNGDPRGYYVFVDVRTSSNGDAAVRVMHGHKYEGHSITVKHASSDHSEKIEERETWELNH